MNTQTKRLSVEELLKPRYIIENEWFDCPYPDGTILVQQTHSNAFGPEMWISGQYTFSETDLKKYPYLVRKLFWWEERKPEEMPEYVKNKWGVVKVDQHFQMLWHKTSGAKLPEPTHFIHDAVSDNYSFYEPATESEYLNYTNSQK